MAAGYKHFLEGERVYLREVRHDDVDEACHRWLNDPEVNRYLETRYLPQSFDSIRRYVQAMDGKRDEIFLAVCLKKGRGQIGNVKLGPINWIHGFGDISVVIGDKDCWGKGVDSEALALVTAYAFETLNLRKLQAGCYGDDEERAKAFEKVGYQREGVLRGLWRAGGKSIDQILLGLLSEEYFQAKKSPCPP
jgi:RimJ/RimL family protein N-acetyltransferase